MQLLLKVFMAENLFVICLINENRLVVFYWGIDFAWVERSQLGYFLG
jgi:hypothetical protein